MQYSVGTLLSEIHKLTYKPIAACDKQSKDTLIYNVLNYVNENYMHPLTLKETAQHFFVDHHYLCRRFKSICGYNFIDYLQFRRIAEATKLLAEGRSVDDILLLCGFESIQHFYRVFKKKTGCTPKQYCTQSADIPQLVTPNSK